MRGPWWQNWTSHIADNERHRPMIREIVHSPVLLRVPSEPAYPGSAEDREIGRDLLDTMAAHADSCVGMAANMIGERRRIIVVNNGARPMLMYNPQILEGVGEYETEEGCLSLTGTRPCKRFRRIKVRYLDDSWRERTFTFTGYVAEIIQHEIDHCDGVVI